MRKNGLLRCVPHSPSILDVANSQMFIDLLLLLRPIPPLPTPSDTPNKPVVYHILELLFCILVDSPANSRTFEKLSGLEAVTRVLKGSTVVKEVR